MDNLQKIINPYTNFCSKKVCTIFYNNILFGTYKSEIYFIRIYFGIFYIVSEIL